MVLEKRDLLIGADALCGLGGIEGGGCVSVCAEGGLCQREFYESL